MRKQQWLKIVSGAAALLLVVAAVAWVVTPEQATPGRRAGTLSTARASVGLSRVGQADDEKPVGDGVIVIQPDHMDVSPPLRDIEPIVAPPEEEALIRFREIGLLPGHEKEGSFSGVDSTLQDSHGPLAPMPSPIQNWDGINNVGYSVRPPDTQGDVGPNHYVQWVNLRFQIWNKTGASLYGPALGNTLWSGFGGKCATTNNGDPVTLYDHLADRWVMMQFALGTVGDGTSDLICIAVSQTADPTGSWYRYSYTWPNTYMPDYPKIGLWPDGYYLSVNQFNDAATAWRGAGVAAFQRSAMLTGASASVQYFNGLSYNSAYGGMLPADWEGSTQPPSGAPCPFAEWDDSSAGLSANDALRIWDFHVDWTTPANSYFGTSGSPFVPTYTLNTTDVDPTLCAATPACIDQPGTTVMLDDLADRLMHRLQYRNFGTYQTLVSNHTVDTNSPAGRAGIHWFELRNTGSAWAINQQGTYGPADTTSTSRWMGSVAMDGSGNMALGYSVTDNVSLYPSIRYVGRLASDTLGVLPQTETTLVTGGGYQNDSYNRWGDYSAMQIDPSDDCTFWYTQEYAQTNGAYNWYTRIGSFKFPSCGTPDFTLSATPTTQSVCAGNNAAYTINLTSVGGFSSSVALSASGIPSGATATFSPASVTPTGSSTLTIATGTAAAGAYTIGATGTSGSLSHSASVTLNVSTALTAAPTLTAPANGSTGIATMPAFTWGAVTGAASYTIQVSTDPAFGTLVINQSGLTTTSYTPGTALTADTVYYWRVVAVNVCGSRVSSINAFRTAAGCTTYASTDVPKTISTSSGILSTLSIPDTYAVTDVNVTIGSLTHNNDGQLDIHLLGPDDTTVELSTDNGGSGNNYTNTVFDDEASTAITAGSAPFTGTYRPEGLLSDFDGKSSTGASTWRLRVVDDTGTTYNGTLSSWSLTLCRASTAADYSDLASGYGVAWHTGDAWMLGSGWDADSYFYAGYDNLRSDGGVTRNSSDSWNDTRGEVNVTVTGTAGQYACLNAWLDYSDGAVVAGTPDTPDGQFNVANEHVVVNQVMSPGASQLVTWPLASGVINTSALYNMRFRLVPAPTPTVADCSGVTLAAADAALAPDGGAAITGAAAGGEVEDYTFSAGPTAITLASMTAATQGNAIEVSWDTVSEAENAGFNLYRDTSEAGPGIKINTDLIPSQAPGSQEGYHYSYLDNGWLAPDTTYYYWLEDVSTTGVATRHEPVSVLYTGSPTAVSLSRFGAAPVLPALPIAALMMTALVAGAVVARRRK